MDCWTPVRPMARNCCGRFQRSYRLGHYVNCRPSVYRSLGSFGCCSKPQQTRLALLDCMRLDAQLLCFWLAAAGRALQAASQVAQIRGHEPLRLSVKPSFANLLVWKAIYEFDGYYYVDAVRVGIHSHWYPGARVRKLDSARDFPGLGPATRQAQDIERFRWFSDDYLSVMEESPRIVDMRYSLVPNEIDPMWGIDIDASQPDSHVAWWSSRELTEIKREAFLGMVLGLGGVPLIGRRFLGDASHADGRKGCAFTSPARRYRCRGGNIHRWIAVFSSAGGARCFCLLQRRQCALHLRVEEAVARHDEGGCGGVNPYE